jgi:hypothetical protein
MTVETGQFPQKLPLPTIDHRMDMPSRIVKNFQLILIFLEKSQTPAPPNRVHHKHIIKLELNYDTFHILFRAQSFHKENKIGPSFFHHVVKITNCPGVPKPPAVPT